MDDSRRWTGTSLCAIHVRLNVSVGVEIPSDLEPMTGIEPAYSAWEADVSRCFLGQQDPRITPGQPLVTSGHQFG
ncbi:hypothetical protein HOT72_gp045 [Gordonia phage Apricot]|uniref:Uncharacterized protein n=1 Tax=Gordonia phage Apricot TaxID=2250319 RepID=A0A345L1A9_9CAUD|nr:hypothetical protein HOT72_gp045 [Gordonia phage Apricot]AXH49061.1 hypothetical protein SEA_APRICOT_45 [Gordonia phage Apricot]